MKMVTIDWGPKPFRTLDCWFENKDFKGFVEEDWRQGVVHGRGTFVLKEKFKRLTLMLKDWNCNNFGNIHNNIAKIEKE